jgi:hypothetical protein
MKILFMVLFSFSIISASGNKKSTIDAIFKHYQDKYKIYSLDDLNRLQSNNPSILSQNSRDRDPSDLIGNWEQQKMSMGMFITVDTDQTAPTMGSMTGMDPAEGGVTVSNDEFTTVLNYLSVGDLFDFRQRDRNANALQHAQDYVDSAAVLQGQSAFDLQLEFELTYSDSDPSVVIGGLGGDDPGNCDINWPEDPYHMAVYSFVSEYVLLEGASVGCFLDNSDLDLTYGYVAEEIEQSWYGGGGDDNDDSTDVEGVVLMNFDIFSLFAIMFGMDVGIEHPMIMTVSDSYAIAADLSDTTGGYYGGQYMAIFDSNQVSIDMDNFDFSFDNLLMESYYGTSSINVDGEIGAVMYELLSGVETEIPLPSMLLDSAFNDDNQNYLSIYDDGSGIAINVEEDGYYGTMIDTSYFTWNVSNDSIYVTTYDDYYSDSSQVDAMAYFFSGDTLVFGQNIDPCEEGGYYYYYYDTYDDCFEYSDLGNYALGVTGIQDFHQGMMMYYTAYDVVSTTLENNMPLEFEVYPAYPNPFNPVTTIGYYLPNKGSVNITIYDMMGREIKVLQSGIQTPGHSKVQWNATNNKGQPVSAGVYLYQINIDGTMDTKKMVLLK